MCGYKYIYICNCKYIYIIIYIYTQLHNIYIYIFDKAHRTSKWQYPNIPCSPKRIRSWLKQVHSFQWIMRSDHVGNSKNPLGTNT